jgi:hypothetical protein
VGTLLPAVRNILPVKVPNVVVAKRSMHRVVRSYSPGCNIFVGLPLVPSAAASLRLNLNCWVNGPNLENWTALLTANVKGGSVTKVGCAAPIGPMIRKSAAVAVSGQAAEVRAAIPVMSVPVAGVKVRLPRTGGDVSALAVSSSSTAAPAVTATTKAPDTRVKNLFLRTV